MTYNEALTGITYTDDAALADALIRAHLDCANTDTESLTFGCYAHGDYIGVRYTG